MILMELLGGGKRVVRLQISAAAHTTFLRVITERAVNNISRVFTAYYL